MIKTFACDLGDEVPGVYFETVRDDELERKIKMEPYDPTKACPECGVTLDPTDGICVCCGYEKPEEKTEPEKPTVPEKPTKPEEPTKSKFAEFAVYFYWVPAIGLFLLSILILGYQCFLWLMDGFWTPLSPMIVLDKMGSQDIQQWIISEGWVGVKKIILFALNLPLSLVCFLAAIAWGRLLDYD
ncbi:MAG: hypothetical protein FVQ82_02725 [Planctomycetes bacterium]|nr:hypothetical protein [Planctomycetota bacterium]